MSSRFTAIRGETRFTGRGHVTRKVIEEVLERAGHMGYFDGDCPVSVWEVREREESVWYIEICDYAPSTAPLTPVQPPADHGDGSGAGGREGGEGA